jgi:Zn-dependent protease/predicted transcriptional regulator
VTGVLFFVTLLLHELAHSILAKRRGLKVRAITLFALGGVSQIESEAPNAKSEFWIAIAGPLTSLALGGIFLGIAYLTGWTLRHEPSGPVPSVLFWLGNINVTLAVFNMIPGYPLDGGRVLRSLIWWITHSVERATRWASYVGQGVAFLFILVGIWQVFYRPGFGGLWLAFIGWFLLDAARSSYLQVEIISALRGRRVADLMDRDCATVEGHISVQDFVEQYLLRTGRRCFVVVQGGYLVGLITPADVRTVERDRWSQTSIQSVMRPLKEIRTVSPDTPAADALELMTGSDINQLPVVSNGHLEGLFSRAQVVNFLRAHSELHGRT